MFDAEDWNKASSRLVSVQPPRLRAKRKVGDQVVGKAMAMDLRVQLGGAMDNQTWPNFSSR